jgi:starvation-inducible DNA-binding protein
MMNQMIAKTAEKTSVKLFKSAVDLDKDTREHMVVILRQEMADIFDLYSQTKQAHWNVKGPYFFTLHELFDTLAGNVLPFVDLLAERITAMGGEARGTLRMAGDETRLPEYPDDVYDGIEVVKVVLERFTHAANTVREAIDLASEAGDQSTADVFTEISRELDKSLYFLQSYVQL